MIKDSGGGSFHKKVKPFIKSLGDSSTLVSSVRGLIIKTWVPMNPE